jgi:hypothetical protein
VIGLSYARWLKLNSDPASGVAMSKYPHTTKTFRNGFFAIVDRNASVMSI